MTTQPDHLTDDDDDGDGLGTACPRCANTTDNLIAPVTGGPHRAHCGVPACGMVWEYAGDAIIRNGDTPPGGATILMSNGAILHLSAADLADAEAAG